jgi:glyoxylase-like metal-dependent hydrolase (beta-lactamase superfamily II)
MPAERIRDTVWRVAGAGLTDELDCHCYLIWDGRAGLLVDTGAGRAADRWLDNVASVCDPGALTGVVVTHYHADHAGGAAAASAAGLTVYGSPATATALATADEVATSLGVARAAGVYPGDYRLSPAPVLAETTVRGVEIVDAPGHCDGHVVVIAGDMLFSGDCLFAGGRVSIQALHDCRLDRYAATVIALAARELDVLLPGHGDYVLGGAAADISRAAASFRRLVPPPNLLS